MSSDRDRTSGCPICHLDQIDQIVVEWGEVQADSKSKSPFLTIDYLKLWYGCFARPEQVRIYRAIDDGRTVGFLPLVLKKQGPFRILSSLTNDHCLVSEPLIRTGCEDLFSELILQSILTDGALWDLFDYSFSYSFSVMPGLFSDDLLETSGLPWRRETQPTFAVVLGKTFEDYCRNDLSPKFRKNIKMYRKRLEKAGNNHVQHLQGADAVKRWPDFVRIEGSGWKGRAGSSLGSLEANYGDYYDGLVQLAADRQALHLYFLVLKDEPVAAAFCYCQDDIFQYAKIGYFEEHGALSPSNMLLVDIIRGLIEERPDLKMVHLFPWSGGYKHRFANTEATCFETIIYGRTWRGRAKRAVDRLKAVLRKTPGMLPLVNFVRRVLGRAK